MAWSIWSPEKSGTRTVSPIGASFAAASTSVMLVPLPPKSQSTITPAVGRPGFAAQRRQRRCRRRTPAASGPVPACCARAPRSASTTDGRQCAGTATATSDTGDVGRAAGHAVQRLGQQHLRAVPGAVLGDHRDRIADAVDEPGEGQPLPQGHRRGTDDRSLTVAGTGKVGGSNGKAKRIAFAALRVRHVTPLRQFGRETIGSTLKRR